MNREITSRPFSGSVSLISTAGEYPFNVNDTATIQKGVKNPKRTSSHAVIDNETNTFAATNNIVAVYLHWLSFGVRSVLKIPTRKIIIAYINYKQSRFKNRERV